MDTERAAVKVAKAVSGLTVFDEGTVATSMGAAQASPPLGQEGRAIGASSTAHFYAASG